MTGDVLLRTVLARYGLRSAEVTPLVGQGTINANFAVDADGQRWFLRLNHPSKQRAHVVDEARLLERLAARGVPTPRPVRAADGEPCVAAGNRWATLFPWVAGAHDAAPDPLHHRGVAVVGTLLGRLHRGSHDLPVEDLPADHYRLELLQNRLEVVAADARTAHLVPRIADELARALGLRRPPEGLIHQDLFPDNVMVDGDGNPLALIDFEQACAGERLYDVAVALNAWAFVESDGALCEPCADAVVAAYEQTSGFSVDARRLVELGVQSATRFLLTRLTDVFLAPGVAAEIVRKKPYQAYLSRLDYWARRRDS